MFKPKFTFTPKIVNELSLIERLYGQLMTEKLIPSLSLKLSQENQILATHYSTSIEGNPLSPRDVTNIILNDQIPTTKSEKEVKNYFTVLNKIFVLCKENTEISTKLIKSLHHMLMKGIEEKDLGKFRDSSVFVGHRTKHEIVVKHNPPHHTEKEIETALFETVAWLIKNDDMHPLVKAGIFHHQFAYIHPFFDGNGRLARILTTYYLLLKQYEVVKFFILDDYYDIDREMYSDTLHTADKGDETKWLEYFLEGFVHSLQAAISRINEYKKSNFDEITGEKRVLVTTREEDALSIVIDKKAIKTSDIQSALSVTRQQAHALLASLVKKGLLKKYGSTKTSYYKLSKKR
ncbi:MAG: Fic family protein [Candidatus Levyibacteriota bacterium]